MNHRERVLTALNHEVPDRCPMQVGFTPEFADRLRADLNPNDSKAHNPHGGGNTYQLECAIDSDMLITSVGWANSYYQSKESYTDEWGIGWKSCEYTTPFGAGSRTPSFGGAGGSRWRSPRRPCRSGWWPARCP
jgi:uroporphyrinogen decarboxylase